MDKLIREIEEDFEAGLDYSVSLDDDRVRYLIEKAVGRYCENIYLTFDKRRQIVEEIFNRRRRYGILQPLIQDVEINEIMVNGAEAIFYEKQGQILRYDKSFDSKEALVKMIRSMMLVGDRSINEKKPIADTRLAGGERVCAVLDNVAVDGPVLSIRKFIKKDISLEDLVEDGMIDPCVSAFLKHIVEHKYNIIVSGAASSGKTTFLNILSGYIGKQERVITIEDSLELDLAHVRNLVRMETREEGILVDAKKLLKTALRLRPDRIIVGEVRGREAFYMLQAMNTGHDGSMSTGHANSAEDMLARLEAMVSSEFDIPVSSVQRYIASAVDILIHLKKDNSGNRKVEQILQLIGAKNNGYSYSRIFQNNAGKFEKIHTLVSKGSQY